MDAGGARRLGALGAAGGAARGVLLERAGARRADSRDPRQGRSPGIGLRAAVRPPPPAARGDPQAGAADSVALMAREASDRQKIRLPSRLCTSSEARMP